MDEYPNEPDENDSPDGGSGLTEYTTSGGEFWGVDRFAALSEKFGIGAGDLPDWHDLMSKQGRVWDVMQRLYGVSSLVDEVGEDFTRTWTVAELAKKYGVKVGQIELEIEQGVRVWKLSIAQRQAAVAVTGGISQEDFEKLTRHSRTDGLDAATVDGLLDAFNFKEVKGDLLRAQVAMRILSLREYLSGAHTRMQARNLIRMELSMHAYERLQNRYQNELDAALDEDPNLIAKKSEVESLRKKVEEIDAKMLKLGTEHGKIQNALGADETDLTARKILAIDTVAYITEQCRLYESDPENWKPDGFFTAGEIDWLMEPAGERPPQYRPDISVRLDEAFAPENFWSQDYKPTKIQARVVQELRWMVERIRTVRPDEDAVREVDDDDDGDDETAADGGAIAAAAVEPGGQAAAAPFMAGAGRAAGDGDAQFGVF